VIFDLARIADGATFRMGRTPPTGIEHVVVNGHVVVASEKYIDSQHGSALKPLLCD
jgi:hypothetical protein